MTLRTLPPIGEIEIYFGPMFAQKSDRLIEDLRHRRRHGRQTFQLFHPHANTRDGGMCRSRNGKEEPSAEFMSVDHLDSLIDPEASAIGIDEAQFADPALVRLLVKLRDRGQDVLCAGLDHDFRGDPFAVVSRIITLAAPGGQHPLNAWCTECGRKARWSQLLEKAPEDGGVIVVGSDNYAARCERCFVPQR